MDKQTRKVSSSSVKVFGSTWKHPALKPYNGKEIEVEPHLNEKNQTELTVTDGDAVVCIITSKGRVS